MNKLSNTKYTLSVICAGICWGIISLFLKTLTQAGLTLIQTMTIRAIFSAIILFFILLIKNPSLLKIQIKDIWMFIGTGIISLTFFSLCYFSTILESGASVAVVLLYTSPIFVLLLSAIIFHEKITSTKIIAIILTFAGCVLTAGLIGANHSISIKSFLIGLCSGLGYALYSIFSRFALKKYNILTIIFYTFLFSGISLLPFCNIQTIVISFNVKTILASLGISFFCTVLPYVLYTYGLSHLDNSKAAIYVTIEPIVGTLLGLLLYKENFSVLKIVGIFLILIAIVLCSLNQRHAQSK